jgi:hypothetical protein
VHLHCGLHASGRPDRGEWRVIHVPARESRGVDTTTSKHGCSHRHRHTATATATAPPPPRHRATATATATATAYPDRSASVGLNRAAFDAGYSPAIAPISSPAAGAAISAYTGTTIG